VAVKTSVTRTNYQEIPALEARVKSRKLAVFQDDAEIFQRDDGDRSGMKHRLTEEEEALRERARLATLGAAELQKFLDSAAKWNAIDPHTRAPCQATRTMFTIQPNGDVTPCTQTADLRMGNVREQRLSEIWRESEVGRKFRAISMGSYLDERAECAACPFRNVCSKCAAQSRAESGSLTGYSAQKCQTTRVYWTEVRRRAAELGLTCPV
jgi:radical SAM protein with 4Fe4S-binding SPASM domain